MNELVKYFEQLEARIAQLEAEVAELKNRPLLEPQVIEKEVIKEVVVEKPVEVIKEVVVEKPGASPQSNGESGFRLEGKVEETIVPESKPEIIEEPIVEEPVQEEVASPNAALYGKAVDDIRKAISLGDRFLYQRELFGQNAELMQRTLTELNALGSFDEALQYIAQFNWDQESNSYQQFIVTLHRRFG